MALDKQLYTPLSVLIGCAMIALGLYFGLRERAQPPPTTSLAPADAQNVGASVPSATAGARVSTPAQAAPPVVAADRTAAQREAERALEANRADITKKCVTTPGDGPSKLMINITFDGDGRQIARGIISPRDDPRPMLGQCASDALPSLSIPPPGAAVALDLVWTLP